ncbi:MAG: hypothetical protein OXF68_05675, partial [Gammaproteobacteria bacterium]|nr:hypothetical protein [Gammaproteobacteria bacterium]
MQTQVLRIEARKDDIKRTGELRHILGEFRPDTAAPREGMKAVYVQHGDNVRGARAAWTEAMNQRKTKRGRPPAPMLSMLFAGPPPIDGPDAWDMRKTGEWAKASIEWVQTRCPDDVILGSALHMD